MSLYFNSIRLHWAIPTSSAGLANRVSPASPGSLAPASSVNLSPAKPAHWTVRNIIDQLSSRFVSALNEAIHYVIEILWILKCVFLCCSTLMILFHTKWFHKKYFQIFPNSKNTVGSSLCLFLCSCRAHTVTHALELYELSRRKPGWRFTAGVKFSSRFGQILKIFKMNILLRFLGLMRDF